MSSVEKVKLHVPSLNEIVEILNKELSSKFETVHVSVEECPNLKEPPFYLAGEGLCGKTAIADVGGVPYLVPLVQKDKKYSLKAVADHTEIPNALVIGAGAGPFDHVGVNCEMMANVKFGETGINNTHIAKLDKSGKPLLQRLENNINFGVLGNFFISEGKSGKVLKIQAKKRLVDDNFVSIIRKILNKHFGQKSVGVGGVFLVKSSKAKLHVMPDFSKTPLNSDDDVNNWLQFFNMNPPLICLSVFVSHDPNLDLRIEHSHCFSDHGEGGHYHIDTEPNEVEYLGYFNVAEAIYRIDRPLVTHMIGRD